MEEKVTKRDKKIDMKVRKTARFLRDFAEIAQNYEWFLDSEYYNVNGQQIVLKKLRGFKNGQEYCPLTAVASETVGRYFSMERFEIAGGELSLPPECVVNIIDATDDWPDRLTNYKPKGYEKNMRQQMLQSAKLA